MNTGDSEGLPSRTRVELTLNNLQIPAEKMAIGGSPSAQDGLSLKDECDLRAIGCEYIQSCGILLKLPQTAMATGTVLFHRFYYSKSFVRYNLEYLAMASINLASKIEESPRRVRDVINVFTHLKQLRSQRVIRPVILDSHYVETKNQVIKAERRILKELGFCVYVKHPNKLIIVYLRVLTMEQNMSLVQTAWNYANDSLLTDVFLRHTPESITCACIMLAARKVNIALPRNPPWYLLFGVKIEDMELICKHILRLYKNVVKPYGYYEKILTELKEKQDEERKLCRERNAAQIAAGIAAKVADVKRALEQKAVDAAESSAQPAKSASNVSNRARAATHSREVKGGELPDRKRRLPFAPSDAMKGGDAGGTRGNHRRRDKANRESNRRRRSSETDTSSGSYTDTDCSISDYSPARHRSRRSHHHHQSHRRHERKHRRSNSLRCGAERYEPRRVNREGSARRKIEKSDRRRAQSDRHRAAQRRSVDGAEVSSGEERFLRMQLIKQAVQSMDERQGNKVLRAERMRRFNDRISSLKSSSGRKGDVQKDSCSSSSTAESSASHRDLQDSCRLRSIVATESSGLGYKSSGVSRRTDDRRHQDLREMHKGSDRHHRGTRREPVSDNSRRRAGKR